jgi:hypothetical protein
MTSAAAPPSEPRKGAFLRQLRRFHAWVGLAGASIGLLFGLTGFLMSHRSVMKIEVGHAEPQKIQIELDHPPATIEELAATLAAKFGAPPSRIRTRVQAPRPARFGGQAVTAAPQWVVMVSGHAHFARATYLPGNHTLDLERSDAGLIEAMERLHKQEAGQAGWILLADAFAGALLFLILSGTLLWTRLAGPRLLSAGLVLGGLVVAVSIAVRAW